MTAPRATRTRRNHEEIPHAAGFGRDIDTSARSATPPERVAFDPSQHLSPIRVHRDRSRRRSRARRVENSRGAVKRKRERFARRTHVASLNPITPRYILARFIACAARRLDAFRSRRARLPMRNVLSSVPALSFSPRMSQCVEVH